VYHFSSTKPLVRGPSTLKLFTLPNFSVSGTSLDYGSHTHVFAMQYLKCGRIVGHTWRISHPISAHQLSHPEARQADLGCHIRTVDRLEESIAPWGDLDY